MERVKCLTCNLWVKTAGPQTKKVVGIHFFQNHSSSIGPLKCPGSGKVVPDA